MPPRKTSKQPADPAAAPSSAGSIFDDAQSSAAGPPDRLVAEFGEIARRHLDKLAAIDPADLFADACTLPDALRRLEEARIARALLATRGNVQQAAELLGLPRGGSLPTRLARTYPEIERAARTLREADGWGMGNPLWTARTRGGRTD